MFKAQKKFVTTCSDRTDKSIIFRREYEAIDKEEAVARAYLNCVREHKGSAVDISAHRVFMP